jgi:nucleoside-diphosphate-sugar epimerase
MNVIMLRFFFVYGPGQKRTMLIPRLIDSVKNGTPITLQGSDGIRINPTYAGDAASAIKSALDLTDSQKINVGGPDILSLRQIGEMIGDMVEKDPVFTVQNELKPKNIIGDIQKMTKLLGAPTTSFREGIHHTN